MRLGKRTASAMLAFTLAAAMTGTSISVPVPERAQAAESGVETTASVEEGSALAAEGEKAAKTAETVAIEKVTIADTYYSVDGKLPLYVEYFLSEKPEYKRSIKLTVTKEDGNVVAEGVSDYFHNKYYGKFQFEECSYVEVGKNYRLTFTITDLSSGKELFKETKNVGFEEKNVWADRAYLPTGETSYNIKLSVATGAAMVSFSAIDGVCFLDKDNQVVADGPVEYVDETQKNDSRYGKSFFEGSYSGIYHEGWKYTYISSGTMYRTRKLEPGEILEAAYSVDGTIVPTGYKLTVTNQPYVTHFNRTFGVYSGEENVEVIVVNGKHIDFDKLSFVLKDRKTDKEVAHSVSSVTRYQDEAYYALVWSEEYKDKNSWSEEDKDKNYISCDIEYQYDDTETTVIDENVNQYNFSSWNTECILWNPKTDSIEYHNTKIPTGAAVSYKLRTLGGDVTGSGIIVDNNHHMEIVLKETFGQDQFVQLYASYLDEEGEEHNFENGVTVYKNIQRAGSGSGGVSGYPIYSSIMNPMYYLSDSECTFSPELICNDESKLVATGSAVIYDAENQEVGTVELSREKLDNDRFVFKGTYKDGLTPGNYRLKFAPDKNYEASYDFRVQDKTILGLHRLDEEISYGYIELHFTSKDIADWYCSEENQKKLSVKLLDIHDREIAAYTWKDGDFTVEDGIAGWSVNGNKGYYFSTSKKILFSKEVKKELDKIYYCKVRVYYDGKEAVYAERPSDVIRDTYIHSADNEINGWLNMTYRGNINSWKGGKYTYSRIIGSESAFPAVLTITDWYSMKKRKEIKIEKSGYILTEEDLKGLSANKVYSCYLKGADGCIDFEQCYLSAEAEYKYNNPWWTSFSDFYRVSGDFDVTLTFSNQSDGAANEYNYCVGFANAFTKTSPVPTENEGYKEYYLLRSDAYGWSPKGDNITQEGNPVNYDYDWNWNRFKEIMKDSKVTMNIKRTGNDFVVDAKILGSDAKEYSYVTKFTTNAEKEMTLFLTSEYAEVSNVVFKNNQEIQKPVENKPGNSIGIGSNGGGTGGTTITQPEKNEPAKEEVKPEETPTEDTEKEEPKQEETPAEDTNKEETKEPEKETQNPSKDKKNTSKAKGKLTLKKTKLVINKGQKAKIKITSKLNTKVTYRSLNKKVAAVSSKGTVTAKKKGKAVIVVKANGKKKKVTVTVKGASEKKGKQIELEEDFSLSASKAVLKKGNKLTIQKASGLSGKVTFRSLNKKIASVSSKGVIKARKKGKTTILIKNAQKTIKLKITVNI